MHVWVNGCGRNGCRERRFPVNSLHSNHIFEDRMVECNNIMFPPDHRCGPDTQMWTVRDAVIGPHWEGAHAHQSRAAV